MTYFSKKIKALRIVNDLMQKDVADELGIKANTYQTYEKGRTEPSFELLIKIAEYYKVSIDSLLGYDHKDFDGITEEEKELLKGLRELDRDEKNKLKGYLKALIEYKERGHR